MTETAAATVPSTGLLNEGQPKLVAELLATAPTALFLGAGPSCALGGPSWGDLERKIRDKFVEPPHRQEFKERGWWDLMDFVCESLGLRSEVEAFVRVELSRAGPEPWFADLISAPWNRIYTTNYDDVAARANATAAAAGKRFETYAGGRLPYNPIATERSMVKIMGDLGESFPAKAAMILCRADLTISATAEAYRSTLQALRDDLDSGHNVVVVGQSLEDRILLSVLQDLARTRGSKPAGKLVVVGTRRPKWDIQLALAKLAPIYVPATAAQLADALRGVEAPLPPEPGLRIQMKGQAVLLGTHAVRILENSAVLIDENSRGAEFEGPEDFLARSAYSKKAFDAHWDFKRTLSILRSDGKVVVGHTTIPNALTEMMAGARGKTAVLSGPPGAAKTMTALRVAHDWAVAGGLVLLADAQARNAEGGLLAEALEAIEAECAAQTDLGADQVSRLVLIIVDNAGSNRRFIDRFRSVCASRKLVGHSVFLTCKPPQLEFLLPLASVSWEVGPRLELAELNRLADYARSLPHPPTPFEIDAVRTRAAGLGFWGVLYQLAAPSRQPLERSIVQHCNGFERWAQDVAALTACFEVLGIPLPLIVVSRIVPDKTRMEMRQELDGGMLGQVAYLNRSDDFDCIRFVNLQAAEALMTSWKAARPPYAMVHSVIGAIGGANEQAAAAWWLTQGLSQRDDLPGSVAASLLTLADLEGLMGTFSDRYPSAVTIHHHGRMLRKRRRFDRALQRLEEAARQPDAHGERSHIAHGIAVTCVRWAEDLLHGTNHEPVAELLTRAEDNLRAVASNEPSFIYCIRAELLVCRARIAPSPESKKQAFAQAFFQAKYAHLFARTEKTKAEAVRVLGKVVAAMGTSVVDEEEAAAFAKDHRSAAGYERLLESKLGPSPWTRHTKTTLEAARDLAERALLAVPGDALVAHTLARVLTILDPTSPRIHDVLDLVDGAGLSDDAMLLRAFQDACAGRLPAMRSHLSQLRERFPGYEISPERRPELLICSSEGKAVFPVRTGTPNWIQVGGERVSASNWGADEKVNVEVTPEGLMLRAAAGGQ